MNSLRNKIIMLTISVLSSAISFAGSIDIAIIDTGIDPTNDAFKNRLYVGNKKATPENYGVDFSLNADFEKRPYDQHGHGTHIAGIIAKLAPMPDFTF